MKRQIARSPFQLEELEVGEPRPVYRRLVFASPYSLGDTDQHLLPAPAIQRGSVQIAQRNCNASQCIDASLFPAAVGRSLRSDNNAAKVLLLDKWVAVAESLRDCSSVLQPFPHLSGPALHFLFADREVSTLSKHMSGWLRWCEFAKAIQVPPGKPAPAAVLDFAQALSMGARVDRGCERAARAQGVMQALKVASLGCWKLMEGVSCPAVAAWVSSGKWEQAPPREAF